MTNIRFANAAALTAALTLAGALALAGCTAAAATTGSASKPADLPGLTHITAYSIDTDNPVLASVVSGAIGDYGPATEISAGGTGGAGGSAHGGELELDLARGSFRLDIAGIDQEFVNGTSHEPVYPRTCSTFVSVTGAVPIVPGSGTGAYRGIAGTFAMTLTLNEVHDTPCAASLSILRQVIVLSGAGNITKRSKGPLS